MNENESTLYNEAHRGNIDGIKALIAAGVDVNARNDDGFTALFAAPLSLPHIKDKDHLAVTRLLVEAGADVNIRLDNGQTPLFDAAAEGRHECVTYLHQQGADINAVLSNGYSALHEIGSLQEGRITNYKVTITNEAGQQVTLSDPDAIRQAIGSHPDDEYADYVQTAAYLIEQGVDLNTQTEDSQQTALHHCASSGAAEICALILKKESATIDQKDKWGVTPLHYAARNGQIEAVKVLLEAGADINAQEDYGFTPLHEAVASKDEEMVSLLLSHAADLTLGLTQAYKAYQPGTTPLDIAIYRHYKAIIALIEAHP